MVRIRKKGNQLLYGLFVRYGGRMDCLWSNVLPWYGCGVEWLSVLFVDLFYVWTFCTFEVLDFDTLTFLVILQHASNLENGRLHFEPFKT